MAVTPGVFHSREFDDDRDQEASYYLLVPDVALVVFPLQLVTDEATQGKFQHHREFELE